MHQSRLMFDDLYLASILRIMSSVTVRVPATTANLGPGYDCLGVALSLSNRVKITRDMPMVHKGMVKEVATRFFETAKVEPWSFGLEIEGEVPRSRGLGSSVTVRLGLLTGLNSLSGSPLSKVQLFELCAELEGHPDNAAPGAFGGFTVARAGMETLRCEVAKELKFVLLVPDFEVSTPDARKVLPKKLERLKAAESCANACRITAAFMQKRYDLLKGCFADELHQPYREELNPFLTKVIAAGEKAGALGGFLSGSGSTICCVTLEREMSVSSAMLDASPPGSQIHALTADNEGAVIVD